MARTTLRGKGQLTLPAEVRAALHVEDGDEIEFEVVDDAVVMHGMKMIPAAQAWFWTKSWQDGEVEADDDIKAGRTEIHKSPEEMFEHLGF
jgi:antitoxin PrlF